MNAKIELDGITKRFPKVVANDEIDLAVERGSVHALLGENGAGKTTLMNVLYGLYQPEEGTIFVDGNLVDFSSPADAIEAGIGMIHQHFMLVDPMTVSENIFLGDEPQKWFGLAVDGRRAHAQIEELCERYGFEVDPGTPVETLSVGVQQRVEILRTLHRGADLLILDEPTAVLTPPEVEDLFAVFDELTAEGKTIVFITHKLDEAMTAADRITVLRDGENVGTLESSGTTREELAGLMVGREVLLDTEKSSQEPGDRMLSVSDVSVTDERDIPALQEVDFEVREGEIFGVAGVDGNGQSELAESIVGLRTPDSGAIKYRNKGITTASRRERIAAGLSFIPDDRQERGLVMNYSLVKNGLLGNQHLAPFSDETWVDWEETRGYTDNVVDEYDVEPANPEAGAKSLSGGNQQKFIVGREFERDPDLVVASNPTRGVDIGSIEFIHERLLELRDDGKAVVLISSKLDEVQQLSDRLAVLYEGQIMGIVDPAETGEEEIGLLMAGQRPETSVESASVTSGGELSE